MTIRTYRELSRIQTFEDRFDYLKLGGYVGRSTFGFDRYLNQRFYRSVEWKSIRQHVLARDLGCDLGVEGYEIFHRPIIHHMNPIESEDIIYGLEEILNPEFLITTTHQTHNAIHYGDFDRLPNQVVERRSGDTTLW